MIVKVVEESKEPKEDAQLKEISNAEVFKEKKAEI